MRSYVLTNSFNRLVNILGIDTKPMTTPEPFKIEQDITKDSYKIMLAKLKGNTNNQIRKERLHSTPNPPGTLILQVVSHKNVELRGNRIDFQPIYPEILKNYVNENAALIEYKQISQAIKQIQLDKGTNVALETLNEYEAWAERKINSN
ncbi:TPA: hypothetical protein NQN30_001863 [Legionella pneumophila]|nr:hypothetical protein [Legionella pneumophila subsp. pneumophila]HCJ1047446.1 hypothetical protein [Legionella pneumophila]